MLPNPQRLDREGLEGRVGSASYMPAVGATGHTETTRALQRLFDRHQQDGTVTLEQETEIYFGRLGGDVS